VVAAETTAPVGSLTIPRTEVVALWARLLALHIDNRQKSVVLQISFVTGPSPINRKLNCIRLQRLQFIYVFCFEMRRANYSGNDFGISQGNCNCKVQKQTPPMDRAGFGPFRRAPVEVVLFSFVADEL